MLRVGFCIRVFVLAAHLDVFMYAGACLFHSDVCVRALAVGCVFVLRFSIFFLLLVVVWACALWCVRNWFVCDLVVYRSLFMIWFVFWSSRFARSACGGATAVSVLGEKGGSAIGQALEKNTTLQNLVLGCAQLVCLP